MKLYKLVSYILFFSFIWISCDSDEDPPQIQINSPTNNTTVYSYSTLAVDVLISDNKELDFAAIVLTGPDNSAKLKKIELTGDSASILEEFVLDYTMDGNLKININVVDRAGNSTVEELNLTYTTIETGSIDLNVKLEYNGEPLSMFKTYNYPDGKAIDFTRCSFYTSEMRLDETIINEVEFHNLTNSHSSPDLAESGYTWRINNVPTSTYEDLSFNIGVPPELNEMDPGEFPSGHPLAKPAENWFSWRSYIFLKVEGNVDLTGDGETETGVAIHTGSDVALRNVSIPYPIQIEEGKVANIDLVFDIYKLFDGEAQVFVIEETPQIHSLSQIDAVEELSNNLMNSIQKF